MCSPRDPEEQQGKLIFSDRKQNSATTSRIVPCPDVLPRSVRNPPPPVALSHRVHGVPRLSVELRFPENFLSKRSPWGVRPVPPVPRPARANCISHRLFGPRWPKMASKTAQDGQNGPSCVNVASKVVPNCSRWPPKGLQDGPGDPQDASKGAP